MRDWKAEITRRLKPLALDPLREAELVEELSQDAEDRYATLVGEGVEPAEATTRLLADLDEAALAQSLRVLPPAAAAPPVLGVPRHHALADIWQDLRYGARTLRKNPLFTTLSVVTLALGIGATTAMFSVVNTVLIAPLPFPEPARVVQIWGAKPDAGWAQSSLSHANLWDLIDLQRDFSDIGGIGFDNLNLTRGDTPERVAAARVSVGFFRALGVVPVAGRLFADGEDRAGHDTRVVVLSNRLWQIRFGADPHVVGRVVSLDASPHTVIGVLPAGTPWLDAGDIFLPLVRTADAQRGSFELLAVGRLRPGVSAAQGAVDLRRVARLLRERFPDVNKGFELVTESSSEWVADDTLRRALWILMGAVACLLLIACVNLVNLLLAHATDRAREVALRAALGAGRGRIVRQLVVESTLLGALGGVIGLAGAFWAVGVLRELDVAIPRLEFLAVDVRVLGFTIAIGLLTSVATGLAAAWPASKVALVPALREGERGAVSPRQRRMRQWLVGVEVALSVTLLIGAGLLYRSFDAIMRTERGFQTEHRVLVQVNPPSTYDPVRATQLADDVTARARVLPGVLAVAAVSSRPLGNASTGLGIGAPGRESASRDVPWATWRLITPEYFTTMGVPLLKGRNFRADEENGWRQWEKAKTPMPVIVSQRVARTLYPDADPVGREIILWKGQGDTHGLIVGVVGDMRERSLSDGPTLAVYMSARGVNWSPMQFVLKTTTRADVLVPALRALMAGIDRAVSISDVRTLDEIVSASMASRRFTMSILAGFAMLALLLALGGIYGVLAYAVARRSTEIGVRVALGASARSVLRLIVTQGMRPVVTGIVVGLVAALGVSRLLVSLLYGITATDVTTYAAVIALIVLIGLVACLVPARRALGVDVVAALRAE
jgi:putative ABC transport system permease protein